MQDFSIFHVEDFWEDKIGLSLSDECHLTRNDKTQLQWMLRRRNAEINWTTPMVRHCVGGKIALATCRDTPQGSPRLRKAGERDTSQEKAQGQEQKVDIAAEAQVFSKRVCSAHLDSQG